MPKKTTLEERVAWHVDHQKHCGCRPIPAKLQQLLPVAPRGSQRSKQDTSLQSLLSGGDRRSIARSARARAAIEAAPKRVAELAKLADDRDWLVAMRAMDLLEKLAHEHPDWVQPYKSLFIGPLADSDKWEIRLQVVRALPLLSWTPRERKRVLEIVTRDAEHPQKFVRAWALDSLATFACDSPRLMPAVMRGLNSFERSGSLALQTRARQIRKRVGRTSSRA